jgi:hypothetical protein
VERARAILVVRRFPAALALAVLGLGACDSPETSSTAAWCTADSGATVAFTPASDPGVWARDGRGAPHFVELWRAGGLNEGEELGFPLNASVSREGRLAIADFMLSELAVVDPDGTWHDRWAQPGNGPGELSKPVAANWDADGVAVVFDIAAPKMLFIGEKGAMRADVPLPIYMTAPVVNEGSLDWAGAGPEGTALLQPSPHLDGLAAAATETTPTRSVLLWSGPDRDGFDTLASATTPTMGGPPPYGSVRAPGWPTLVAAIGSNGQVAVGGETDRYRVRMTDREGRTTKLLCRDVASLPIGSRETERSAGAEPVPRLESSVAEAPRPEEPAPYGRLFFSGEGRLWVQRERASVLRFIEGYYGVPGAHYDVFDPDGTYLGEVRAPEKARFQAALGDTVWAYEIGDLDETWVVAYQMRWD